MGQGISGQRISTQPAVEKEVMVDGGLQNPPVLPWAERIAFCWFRSRHCRFTIDQCQPVTVREPNGTLLALLARDESASEASVKAAGGEKASAIVPFKRLNELAAGLTAHTKRQYSDRAVAQRIWRLRNLLTSLSLDRNLIEGHQTLGYRFRVARCHRSDAP